jgi:hypothetical protein
MDANEHRLVMLEERLGRYENEMRRIVDRQSKSETDMYEFHVLFERHATKLDNIHDMLISNKKSTAEWVRWVPGFLFGGVALVIALLRGV